jgi:uncharacterized Ntn-hydrolase superfamily protein
MGAPNILVKALAIAPVLSGCATLEEPRAPARPLSTFSIVARDPETGELGVAVQSHWFSVGSVVPWAEAGVGAVATQSFVNPAYGPDGLARMKQGVAAPDALAELVAKDPGASVRQVAFVDARGGAAAHTGERCIASAAHHVGAGYSVQANMMENERVVPAMSCAFEATQGPLAERLLAALEAAQREGGDIRGEQSAALLVVRPQSSGKVWEDRTVDLRVEDAPNPVEEIRRLYRVHQAYEHMNAGDLALEHEDLPRAMAEYARAAELHPDNLEIVFWNAFTLATNERLDESVPFFRKVFAKEPRWIELLKRLPASELCSEEQARAILEKCGTK